MLLINDFKQIYRKLTSDEELLRLLLYPANNLNDNIHTITSNRPSIMKLPPQRKWEIINKLIVPDLKTTDLIDVTDAPYCRVIFYPSRITSNKNVLTADSYFAVEKLVHDTFSADFRKLYLIKRICELLVNKPTCFKGMELVGGGDYSRTGLPADYTCFRLDFKTGSIK